MNKRVTKTVGRYDVPTNLEEAISFFQGVLDNMPAESRPSATLDFDVYEDYGSLHVDIEFTHTRPETKEEAVRRKERDSKVAAKNRAMKIATIAKLQKELSSE